MTSLDLFHIDYTTPTGEADVLSWFDKNTTPNVRWFVAELLRQRNTSFLVRQLEKKIDMLEGAIEEKENELNCLHIRIFDLEKELNKSKATHPAS